MLFVRSAAAALGLLLLVTACSSKSGSGSSLQTQGYAQSLCDWLNRCSPADFKSFFADPSACPPRLAHVADSFVGLSGVSINQSQVDSCAGKLPGSTCGGLPDECNFRGTLAVGAPCSGSLQCATGDCFFTDTPGQTALCGKCAATVGEGADCTNTDCNTGLVCANGKCAAPAQSGQACDESTRPCADPLVCVDAKCAAPLAAGADCGLTATSPPCDTSQGLTCLPTAGNTTAGKCQPAQFGSVGQKCGIQPDGGFVSCAGSSCVKDTCAVDSDEGGPCDPTNGPFCGYGFDCVGGKCEVPAAITCN
jgi:hypothetical protein